MQVFLPDENLQKSAEYLDDVRLSKQITEINQIVVTAINRTGGHYNHPVNVHYRSFQGLTYLLAYNQFLCAEYKYRQHKYHMGYFTCLGLIEYVEQSGPEFPDFPCFRPAYIKGVRGVNQIIDAEKPFELYRQLLCDKWAHDNETKIFASTKPKWTGRSVPVFFANQDKEEV